MFVATALYLSTEIIILKHATQLNYLVSLAKWLSVRLRTKSEADCCNIQDAAVLNPRL